MTETLKAFENHLKGVETDISPLTIKTYIYSVEQFKGWIEAENRKPLDIHNITPNDIESYKEYMLKKAGANGSGYKPATINKILAALRVFFGWLIFEGQLKNNQNPVLVQNIKGPSLAPRWLDIEREWRPLKNAVEKYGSKRDIAIILLIRYTGIRARDLLALKPNDIQLSPNQAEINVRYGRAGRYRKVALDNLAGNALRAYLEERIKTKNSPIFYGKRGPLTYQGLRFIVEKYSKLAGLKNVTLQMLRNTYGVNLISPDEPNEEFYRTVSELAYDGIAIVDQGLFTYANPSLARILGRDKEDLIGAHFGQFLSKESFERIGGLYVRAMGGEQITPQFEGAVIKSDGSVLDVEFTASALDYPPNPRILIMTRDISKQKNLENQLREMATIDSLTRVSNRRRLFDLAEVELKKSARLGQPLSIIIIDLDKFKRINDNYGHLVGDKVLKYVAQEIKSNLREIDVLARYGGDEFVILMPQTNLEQAELTAQRLIDKIDKKILSIDAEKIHITLSLGVSNFRGDGKLGFDDLLDQADKALYQAKLNRRKQKNMAAT